MPSPALATDVANRLRYQGSPKRSPKTKLD